MFPRIIIVTLLFTFLTGGVYFLIKKDDSQVNSMNQTDAIKSAIKSELKSSLKDFKINLNEVEVTHQDFNYARANFKYPDGNSGIVFLVKTPEEWKVVEMTQGDDFFCEKMDKFGFPLGFIGDCSLEFPQALSVSKMIKKIQNDLVTRPKDLSEKVKIIGLINFDKSPNDNSFSVVSGGESVEVSYDPNDFLYEDFLNLSSGDQVIIDLSISKPTEIENDENDVDEMNEDHEDENVIEEYQDDVIFTVDSIDDIKEVNEDEPNLNLDDSLDSSDSVQPSEVIDNFSVDQDNFSGSVSPTEENNFEDLNIIYDITDYPPDAVLRESYFTNLLDIDNSNNPIKIIGS